MNSFTIINKPLRSFFILCTLFMFLCVFSCCGLTKDVDNSKSNAIQKTFDTFLESQFCSSFENDLINLHYTLKNPEAFHIEKPAEAFADITPDYPEQMKAELLETKKTLHQIDQKHLTEEQKRIYRTLDQYLKQQIELCDYPQFLNPLSYATGISSTLPLTLAEYAFYTEEDILDYLSILPQVPELLQQAYDWEKSQSEKGYGMADFEIAHTIEQIDTFLGNTEMNQDNINLKTVDNNILVETFKSRLSSISELSEDQKNTYLQNNRELIANTVLPAFWDLKANLMDLQKTVSERKGLFHYEKGLTYYEILLASMTLSDRSMSNMIHTLEERLNVLINRISDQVIKTPDIYDIFLTAMDENKLPDQTPKEMLLYLEDKINKDYPELSNVNYLVEPIPKSLENDTTAAYYLIPPYDSPEENRIYYGSNPFWGVYPD